MVKHLSRLLFREHVNVNNEQVNVNKWAQKNVFRIILLTLMEFS
jgi:hypothetical protein